MNITDWDKFKADIKARSDNSPDFQATKSLTLPAGTILECDRVYILEDKARTLVWTPIALIALPGR